MDPQQLKDRLSSSVFAFRGYNITNLGRSPEFLAHPMYGAIVRECLRQASVVCSEITGRRVNLVDRVRRRRETTLRTYADALALVMAMEQAHMLLLAEYFDIEIKDAKFAMGFSLGEITAVALSGMVDLHDAMRVPLSLAQDCAELAADVSLGVLFSRGRVLPIDQVRKMCLQINQAGQGVIGISAHLSPNSLLLMGQGKTLERFKAAVTDLPDHANFRKNSNRFPPLHTPIVWQRNVPNRAAVMMHTLKGGFTIPEPPVLSLVTGKCSYNEYNARETLRDWTDHPQLLWDVIYETLRSGIKTVIHVGPEPNIIPATYKRLHDNVEAETKGRIGMRALTAVVHHPWIKLLLPERTALLRAPLIEHVVLEDWLLAQHPA
jgi:[acyl-carrier-protein] S-malonyltransferase